MKYLAPIPKQFVDQNGLPLSNGTVHVYISGDTQYANVYQDADGNELMPNPARLDSNGAWVGFVTAGIPLDYVVEDKDGNVQFEYERVVAAQGGGGGGGGNDYFAKTIGLYNNIGIFPEEDKIKIYWNEIYRGLGGFGYIQNIVPNGFEKIEMKITKYLAQGGGDNQVISYRSSTSGYNDGRLFQIEHNPDSGELLFKVAQDPGSWMKVYSGNYPKNNEYEYYVEITKQGSLYNFKLYVNGNLVYNNNHMLYNGGLWSPQICLSYYYGNRTPGYANLRANEYIVMSKSYLYIDDVRFFGFK